MAHALFAACSEGRVLIGERLLLCVWTCGARVRLPPPLLPATAAAKTICVVCGPRRALRSPHACFPIAFHAVSNISYETSEATVRSVLDEADGFVSFR